MYDTYHASPPQSCLFTASCLAAMEVYLGSPVTLVGLHKESQGVLFVLPAPTKALRAKLRVQANKNGGRMAYWGSWSTTDGRQVKAYRLLHKDESAPNTK
mgnify:CR=1 FL=1|jgi:hypothetical protein